ncbi:hypothetical protein [Nocardioides rubriscoriae]|uniref:hypothetical protein n=1 Tax=Nocardioides rubriscoriae TaxID=642762 RepID=UPI0011DFDDA9|nr:hypothetical protein [Nocardioides rubriscoriae]
MATKYDVRVTEASASATVFRTIYACSCGWSGAAEAPREAAALAAAARARVDHLLDAHPQQTPSAFLRPRTHARYRHMRSLSAASQHGRRWSRHAACACGWTDTVRAGSPEAAARAARARHESHVQLQTGRTPTRDYLVMAAVVLVVAAVLVAMAVAAIQAAGGDPRDLTDLGDLFG